MFYLNINSTVTSSPIWKRNIFKDLWGGFIVVLLLPLRLFLFLQCCSRTCRCSAQSHRPVTRITKREEKCRKFKIGPCQIVGCCKWSSSLDAPPKKMMTQRYTLVKLGKTKRQKGTAERSLLKIPTSGVNCMLLLNTPSAGSNVWKKSWSTMFSSFFSASLFQYAQSIFTECAVFLMN